MAFEVYKETLAYEVMTKNVLKTVSLCKKKKKEAKS
jgi:hypothetical protein